MKKIIGLIGLIGLIGIGQAQNSQQAMVINQLRGSIVSMLKILKEPEQIRQEKLEEGQLRSNLVVWYYNYLTMIENDPYLSKKEKELTKELLFEEASRIYKEKYSQKNWIKQARRNKIDKEFLEYHLMTDRFMNLVLWVYEKYDEDVKAVEDFLKQALNEADSMEYILKDLNENISVAKFKQYKIKPGDNLFDLFGKKWKKIADYNGIKDPTKLRPGQVIVIPKQTITIPKDVDKTTQLCLLAADEFVSGLEEKIIVAEITLAILRIETQEGRQIGTGNYHADMNPNEKISFLKICQKLGLDPETTLVSKKPYYGWGGAMGPAQFLPSTWLAYESNVSALTGKKFVSPYNLKDAIFAIASKLVSGGVASGGDIAERRAAMLYFAGKNWDESKYQFYWNRTKLELDKIRRNKEIENIITAQKKEN